MSLSSVILIVLLSLIAAALLFWKFVFLRNPERKIPAGGNSIVSAADGKVIDIIRFDGSKEVSFFKGNKRYLGLVRTLTGDVAKKGWIVSVFMNVLSVHYNRSPIAGKVLSVTRTKGRFLPVNTIEAGLVNEKVETLIQGQGTQKQGKFRIKVIQIAGILASKITTFAKPGDKINKGQRIGLINLGSQVTLILPDNVRIKVRKGQKVRAGETVIAEIKRQ